MEAGGWRSGQLAQGLVHPFSLAVLGGQRVAEQDWRRQGGGEEDVSVLLGVLGRGWSVACRLGTQRRAVRTRPTSSAQIRGMAENRSPFPGEIRRGDHQPASVPQTPDASSTAASSHRFKTPNPTAASSFESV